MLLNSVEFISMNNSLRTIIQDIYELPVLRRISRLAEGKKVLEIGCGNGAGAKLINKYFKPHSIDAIDLDPRMITIANRKRHDANIRFQIADAAKLPFPNNSFDAVFDFGIIHHVPNWKRAVSEIHRVLKPGGQLIMEDLSIDSFHTWFGTFLKSVLAHPYGNMFTTKEFIHELQNTGMKIIHYQSYYPLKIMKYFTVYANK